MKDLDKCPLCRNDNKDTFDSEDYPKNSTYLVNCERCGEFEIHENSVLDKDIKEKLVEEGFLLSGLSRELSESGDRLKITNQNIDDHLGNFLVPDHEDFREKSNKLLKWLLKKSDYYGDRIDVRVFVDYPIAYATGERELSAIINFLESKGLVEIFDKDSRTTHLIVTSEGWETSEGGELDSKKVFVAAWCDDKVSDSVQAIRDTIDDLDYSSVFIEDDHFSEKIIDKAIAEIKRSRFIVVDLTGVRYSVFWEIGFAKGLGKEIIYLYQKDGSDDGIPDNLDFYVRHYTCTGYNNPNEIEELLKDIIESRGL